MPSSGDLPNLGVKPMSPALAGRFFTTEPPGKPPITLHFCAKPSMAAHLNPDLFCVLQGLLLESPTSVTSSLTSTLSTPSISIHPPTHPPLSSHYLSEMLCMILPQLCRGSSSITPYIHSNVNFSVRSHLTIHPLPSLTDCKKRPKSPSIYPFLCTVTFQTLPPRRQASTLSLVNKMLDFAKAIPFLSTLHWLSLLDKELRSQLMIQTWKARRSSPGLSVTQHKPEDLLPLNPLLFPELHNAFQTITVLVVQSISHVQLFVTPACQTSRTAECQTSLSLTTS